jgi:heptosyltransferase-1
VIRLGALGDVLRTLPAVSALRAHYRDAHVAWLVEARAAGALEGQPWIDEILLFPRRELAAALRRGRALAASLRAARFARELRARRFDLVLDFHSILKSGLLSALSRAPLRVAFGPPLGREGAWLFANRRARPLRTHVSRWERNAALLRCIGVEPRPADAPLCLVAGAGEGAERPCAGRDFAALHPGTSEAAPHKRYGLEAWAAVVRALAEAEGLRALVTWGPARGERDFAGRLVRASRGAAELAPETRSFAELAALLARARIFLGCDSGPLHAASLLGTPVVQVLGPTDPVENAPYAATPWRAVRVPVLCSPCRRGCAAATCMRAVPPAEVVAAARALLAETSAQRAALR